MSNLVKRLVGVVALLTIVVLLAGVPVLLVWLGQPFFPASFPSWSDIGSVLTSRDDGTVVVVLLYVVAWFAWVYLALGIVVEAWAAIRRIQAPTVPGLRLPQGIAKRLVGAALLAFIATPAFAHAAPLDQPIETPQASQTTVTQQSPIVTQNSPDTGSRNDTGAAAEDSTPDGYTEHTVVEGDTLWDLADQHLGDPERYPEIFEENEGITQANGAPLTNPDLIVVDTVLQIPQETTTAELSAEAEPPVPSEPEPTPEEPGLLDEANDTPEDPAIEEPGPPETAEEASSENDTASDDVAPLIDVDEDDEADQMPAATNFGAGIILSGGIISLLAGYRVLQRKRRHRGAALAMPVGPAAAVEKELRTVGDTLAIEEVDQALRSLAHHCRTTHQDLPEIHVARMTSDSFELYLAEPRQLPKPWVGIADETLWALHPAPGDDHESETQEDSELQLPAPYPALVTIGQDAEGAHVLLDLETVGELSINGTIEGSEEMLAALAIELATSTWADDLTVTLVGIFPEMEDVLQTGRIRYLPTVGRLFEELQRRAENDRMAMQLDQVDDLHHARLEAKAPSTWYPEIVLLANPLTELQHSQLESLMSELPRVAIATVAVSETEADWSITSEGSGHVLQPIGLAVTPQRLPTGPYQRILEIVDVATNGQEINNEITATAVDSLMEEATAFLGMHGIDSPVEEDLPESFDVTRDVKAEQTEDFAQDSPGSTGFDDEAESEHTGPAHDQATNAAEDDVVEVPSEGNTVPATVELGPEAHVDHPSTIINPFGPKDGQPYLQLLGQINMVGAPGTAEEKRKKRMIEYLAFLMLNDAPTIDAIDDAIWPNRRNQDNTSTRNSVTSRLRKWLGVQEHNNEPRIEMNTYTVVDVGCDWFDFQSLTKGPLNEVSTDALTAAFSLLRGPILKGAGVRYWAWAEPLQQEIISRVIDTCYELALRQLVDADYLACETTLAKGLDIEPGDEQLWRMRILAAHARHNQAAVKEAIDRLYAQLEAFECSPEDETDEFLTLLKKGTATVPELMELI